MFANLKSMVFFAFSSCSLQPSATLLKVQRRVLAKKNIEIAATNQILERADIPGTGGGIHERNIESGFLGKDSILLRLKC